MEAYPLEWPAGYKRTEVRQFSRFERSKRGTMAPGAIRNSLLAELRRLGASDIIVSTNIPTTNGGVFYAKFAQPSDPGVAVYFNYDGEPCVFVCDKWRTVTENVRAITLTIEAIRGMDRWGVSDMLKRVFTGFLALPAPDDPFEVLKIKRPANRATIEQAFKSLAKEHHPDAGGTNEAMAKLTEARRQALLEAV